MLSMTDLRPGISTEDAGFHTARETQEANGVWNYA
jgi:hypothetical protein